MTRRTGREGLHERVVADKRDAETLRQVAAEIREATYERGCAHRAHSADGPRGPCMSCTLDECAKLRAHAERVAEYVHPAVVAEAWARLRYSKHGADGTMSHEDYEIRRDRFLAAHAACPVCRGVAPIARGKCAGCERRAPCRQA